MKVTRSLLFTAFIIAASLPVAAGQVSIPTQSGREQQATRVDDDLEYGALVNEIFAPITEELNLTNAQKFKIVAIVTGTVIKANPLMDQLDELDDRINEATSRETVDAGIIEQLSIQEGQLMTQIIAMKARAKARMFQVLTPAQQMLVAKQFYAKPRAEGSLGSISIYQ